MNILFFLKPKGEVAYIHDYCTLRQVLETMEYHRYSCIPMLNRDGKYVGTITEGDLLWFIKSQHNMDIKKAENVFITDFPRKNCIPMLNRDGKYVGTITEGDLLWFIKSQHNMDIKKAENVFITDFPRKNDYFAVSADADMEDLLQKAMNQNFVPVVDDMNNFIGIITRKSIIEYCYNQLLELKNMQLTDDEKRLIFEENAKNY